jgi:hypothetical protein
VNIWRGKRVEVLYAPAECARIADRFWSIEDVIVKIEERAPVPKSRGLYMKRGNENPN